MVPASQGGLGLCQAHVHEMLSPWPALEKLLQQGNSGQPGPGSSGSAGSFVVSRHGACSLDRTFCRLPGDSHEQEVGKACRMGGDP